MGDSFPETIESDRLDPFPETIESDRLDPFPETIESDRLRLEPFDPESVDVFERYGALADDPDPEDVYEHVPFSPPETPADSLSFLEGAAENRAEAESVTYLIRPRDGEPDAGEIAGTTTLFVQWERRTAESAIVLRKPFWGRGYSGERAAAFLEVVFEHLDLDGFAVSCVVANERSRRAISTYVEAHGGRYDGRFRNLRAVDVEPADLHRFSIDREEYLTATESSSIETLIG
ncbi:GNAT family N-acetyltransferase [Halovivax sp.]|uniref:GNAT family N-acetyltransferase n=1 Tax=Halovivax sp. TaxID=1935978 RepID=UPI0025C2976F|nr:GNAT family protein [Halovivax sp.]